MVVKDVEVISKTNVTGTVVLFVALAVTHNPLVLSEIPRFWCLLMSWPIKDIDHISAEQWANQISL